MTSFFVLSRPPEGIGDEQYTEWYDVHHREVLELEGFTAAERFPARPAPQQRRRDAGLPLPGALHDRRADGRCAGRAAGRRRRRPHDLPRLVRRRAVRRLRRRRAGRLPGSLMDARPHRRRARGGAGPDHPGRRAGARRRRAGRGGVRPPGAGRPLRRAPPGLRGGAGRRWRRAASRRSTARAGIASSPRWSGTTPRSSTSCSRTPWRACSPTCPTAGTPTARLAPPATRGRAAPPDRGRPAAARADVVMVGLGGAGGIAAHVLTAAGLDVVALEGPGPRRGPSPSTSSQRHPQRLAPPKSAHESPFWRAAGRREGPPPGRVMVTRSAARPSTTPREPAPAPVELRADPAPRRYGAGAIPAGSTLADWPISYDDLEPAYDRVERAIGVARRGRRRPSGGQRFEGSRGAPTRCRRCGAAAGRS